jgi:hypothetical protein
MRNVFMKMVCFSALGFAVAAHATTIPAGSYNLTGVTVQDSNRQAFTLTGNVVIGSNGLVTGANIILNDTVLGSPIFNVVNTVSSGGYAPVANYVQITGRGGDLDLYYLPSLDASGNIDLCILSTSCNSYQGSYMHLYGASSFGYNPVSLTGGTLNDPPAAVPEPSSLALVMIGLLSFAGAAGIGLSKRNAITWSDRTNS